MVIFQINQVGISLKTNSLSLWAKININPRQIASFYKNPKKYSQGFAHTLLVTARAGC